MIRNPRTIPQFGLLLKCYRLERGWSQGQMAARINAQHRGESLTLNASTLSRLESMNPSIRRSPSLEMVRTLADTLGLEDVERFRFFAAAGMWEQVPPDDVIERIIDQVEMW